MLGRGVLSWFQIGNGQPGASLRDHKALARSIGPGHLPPNPQRPYPAVSNPTTANTVTAGFLNRKLQPGL